MSNPVLPTIIVSPAIVTWNGYSYYFKKGIKADFKRELSRSIPTSRARSTSG